MIYSYLIAIIVMAIATYIDQKERIVPNWLSSSALAIGIILSCLIPVIHDALNWWQGGLSAIGDCLFVFCVMCWYGYATEKLLNLEFGLGGGDIKIMGALASIVNIKITLFVMLAWPVIGMVNFAILRLNKGEIFGTPCCPAMFAALIFALPFARML
jgi:Flp pilus assembly protein protease CpaA